MATVSETIVRITLDRAAQQKTVSGINSVATALDKTTKQAASASKQLASASAINFKDAKAAADALGLSIQQFSQMTGLAFNEQLSITGELQKQLPIAERLAQAAKVRESAESGTLAALRSEAFGDIASGTGGGRTAGQSITQLGRNIFNAPAVGASTPLARGLIAAGPAIDKLGLSLGQVGVLAGVAGAGIVAVALAMEHFKKSLEAVKRQLESAIEAQNIYYRAIQDLTSAQAAEDIKQRTRDQRRLQQQIQETQGAIDSAWNQLVAQFGDAGARALESAGLTPLTPLREQLAELEADASTNEQAIARLTQGMEQNAFAANDAAEAAQRQADVTIQATRDAIQQQTEFNRLARTGTSEGVREQIAANEDLANALNSANDRLEEQAAAAADAGNTDAWLKLADQIRANDEQIIRLGGANNELLQSILPLIEAREREAKLTQGLTDATDQYFAALEAEGAARAALNETQRAINDELTAFATKQNEIAATLADAEAKAAETRSDALIALEEDAGEKRVKAADDAAKKIAKIERDFTRTYAQAVGDREALDAFLAKQRREDQLQDVEQALGEQEIAIIKSLDKQKKVIEKRYEDQLKAARDAASKATRQEEQRHDRELAIRQRAYDQAQVALQNAMNAQVLTYRTVQSLAEQTGATVRAGMVNVVNTFGQGLLTMVQQVQAAFSRINKNSQYSSPIGPQPNTIGAGYIPPQGNPFLNASFQFLSQHGAPPTQNPASIVFAPQVNGSTPRQVRREIIRHLDRFVEQW